MNRIKNKKNFYLDEFIDPITYRKFGRQSQRYIRPEIIKATQCLRELVGLPITVNNWAAGGSYKESGLRNFNTSTGASYSMHKFGGAADLKIGNLSSFEMVEILKNHEEVIMDLGIRRYENPEFTKGRNRSWLHIDSAWTDCNGLLMVNP